MSVVAKQIIKLNENSKELRILLIAVPGIGDAFLATPLIHSLLLEFPNAKIDIFVRLGSEGILQKNRDINEIIAFPRRPKLSDYLSLYKRIFRRYDIAISTSPSDRSFINCLIAAPRQLAVAPAKKIETLWKYLLATHIVELDPTTHVIDQNLRLIDALEIKRSYEVALPQLDASKDKITALAPRKPYMVLHMMPGSDYKVWPLEKWGKVIEFLVDNSFEIVLTGGNGEKELANCAEITSKFPSAIHNLCGKLSFEEVKLLIEDSDGYLGTDTSTTHLAAATGVLTFAIYGPSNVVVWSPWPKGYAETTPPFIEKAGIQRKGNVVVIRANCSCVDFSRTCSQTTIPESLCLVEMKAELVIEALRENLLKKKMGTLNPEQTYAKSNEM